MSRYLLERELARGGMGVVHVARDRWFDRVVALKVLHDDTPRARARFAAEVALTARLQHPGIVTLYDTGLLDGARPYYAMRLIEGRDLADVVAERATLDERLALIPLVTAACAAVAHAHARGIVHRDLKPANLRVGAHGDVVVVDWGLAVDLVAPDRAAAAGEVAGTPAYMAPEQVRGRPADERADVYALGAVLHSVLAGRPPYQGERAEVLAQAVRGARPPLVELAPGVPRPLAAIVERALAHEPERRYASAHELADELRRFEAGRVVAAYRDSPRERAGRWLRTHARWLVPALVAASTVAAVGIAGLARIDAERARVGRAGDAIATHRRAAEELTGYASDELVAGLASADRLDAFEPTARRVVAYADGAGRAGPALAVHRLRAAQVLAELEAGRGAFDRAESELQRAVAVLLAAGIGPCDARSALARAWLTEAEVAIPRGDAARAEGYATLAESAVGCDPVVPALAALVRARAALLRGQPTDALAFARAGAAGLDAEAALRADGLQVLGEAALASAAWVEADAAAAALRRLADGALAVHPVDAVWWRHRIDSERLRAGAARGRGRLDEAAAHDRLAAADHESFAALYGR